MIFNMFIIKNKIDRSISSFICLYKKTIDIFIYSVFYYEIFRNLFLNERLLKKEILWSSRKRKFRAFPGNLFDSV